MAKSFFLRADIAIETIDATSSSNRRATSHQASPKIHRFILWGTTKADRLNGGTGRNRIYGKAGDDRLKGGSGSDRLYGGTGNDILEGGNHNDHLWGGSGRDIFVLQPGQGVDQIYDFNPALDRLQVRGGLSFRDLSFEVQENQTQIFYTLQGQSPQLLAILVGKFDLQQQHFIGLKPSELPPPSPPLPPPPPPPVPAPPAPLAGNNNGVPPANTPSPTPSPTPPTEKTNQSPTVANPLNQTATEDDAALQVDLLQGASDADGDTLSVKNVTWLSGDAVGVTVTGDRLSLDPNQYNHLAVGETEVIQYEYAITDGQDGQVTQRVTITITGENDIPVAQPDDIQTTLTTLAPVALAGNLLNDNGSGQDSDPEGDTLNIIAVNGSSVGQAIVLTSGASLTVDADGSFQYDFTDLDALKALGQADFITDSVTYTLSDGNGGEATTSPPR